MPDAHPDFPIGLDETIKNNLNSLEECDSFLQEVSGEKSYKEWVEADTLLHIKEKFGSEAEVRIGSRHGYSVNKCRSYPLVAKAFPRNSRIPHLSFSHHLAAMTSDTYNRQTGEFVTNHRFEWLEIAANDTSLKTRDILYQIATQKLKNKYIEQIVPCSKCGNTEGEIKLFVLFAPRTKQRRDQFYLHQDCYQALKSWINGE